MQAARFAFCATLVALGATAAVHLAVAGGAAPLGGGGSLVLEPVPAAPEPRPQRRIVYSCSSGGHVTHSDRPCGSGPQLRELPVAAPGRGPTTVPSVPRASTRPARSTPRPVAGAEPDARAQRCERLREAVAALDQHMRSGYSSREAARLWQRWREAKERLRQARC